MTARIHYTLPDGSTDSLVISADTLEELREKAGVEISSRNASNPWSEILSE